MTHARGAYAREISLSVFGFHSHLRAIRCIERSRTGITVEKVSNRTGAVGQITTSPFCAGDSVPGTAWMTKGRIRGKFMHAKHCRLFSALVFIWILAVLLVPLRAYAGPSYYTVTLATGNLVNPAINSLGQETGGKYGPGNAYEAFLYSNGATMYLGTLGARGNAPPLSAGVAINNLGEVAGWTTVTTSYGYKAFLYSNGIMHDLGTLGGWGLVSIPTDINNLGQVVGMATGTRNGDYLAFLYNNGKMQDLGTLAGGYFSVANGINDSGEIVGVSDTAKGGFAGSDAFLYTGGSMYNLNSLIGNADSAVWLTSATEINDQGQILADGVDIYNHERYTYLLTPTNTPPTCGALCQVSEPGTLGLLGLGIVGLGLTLRRRAASHR